MAKGAYIGVNGVARKIKKGYVGVENFTKRTLPSGYTQVAYIQSSGTQYIDTGFKPNNNTRVVMDAKYTSTSNSQFLFGTRTSSATTAFAVIYTSGKLRSDYNASNVEFANASINDRLLVDKNKNVCSINGASVTNTSSTFQTSYALYLFACNQADTASYFASIELYGCQIYDNGTLIRDYVPCTNSGGIVGLYDMVNNKFYTNAGSETFAAGGTYAGVARKIKKAYIGVGGVARPFWTGGEVAYWGKATALSQARDTTAASNKNYALFVGGETSSAEVGTVDAYNTSLTRSTQSSVTARKNISGGSIGDYALFAGGGNYYDDPSIYWVKYTTVDVYNNSLTRSTKALSKGRDSCAVGNVGGYVVFAGGVDDNNWTVDNVDAFNASLTRTTPTQLTNNYSAMIVTTMRATNGTYAIFARMSTYPAQAYDASLTKTSPFSLSGTSYAGFRVGNYAVFGINDGKTMEAYDQSLTKTTFTVSRSTFNRCHGVTLKDFAVVCYGKSNNPLVEVFDSSLTRTEGTKLTKAASAWCSFGDYALFGGGKNSTTVDVYTVQ